MVNSMEVPQNLKIELPYDPAIPLLGIVCAEGIQPCNMKNRDIYWRRYRIQKTLYIGQCCLSPLQSRHLGTSHSSPNCHHLPHHIFLNLIDGLKSFPLSKVILVLEKARTRRAPNLGYRQSKPPGWFVVSPKNSALNLRQEQVHCHDEAANHQLPITAFFCIIQTVSTEECSSLMQNLMQTHYSTCSVILNATATQYTCSFNGVYCPQWPVQWSCHCSHMRVPVHPPWLPGYIDVTHTILFILTMPDFSRTDHIHIHTHVYMHTYTHI